MKERNLGYFRDGLPLEVALNKQSSYQGVVKHVATELKMKPKDPSSVLALFKANGSLVQSSNIAGKPWTIAEYVRAQHKSPENVKLGIGVIKKDQVAHVIMLKSLL